MSMTTILATDLISTSRQTINDNFALCAPLANPPFTGSINCFSRRVRVRCRSSMVRERMRRRLRKPGPV